MPEWAAALARGDYLAALRSWRASLDDTQPLTFDMLIHVMQTVGSLQVVAFDMDGDNFEWVQAHHDELVIYRTFLGLPADRRWAPARRRRLSATPDAHL
jgi:hypothetical protein